MKIIFKRFILPCIIVAAVGSVIAAVTKNRRRYVRSDEDIYPDDVSEFYGLK